MTKARAEAATTRARVWRVGTCQVVVPRGPIQAKGLLLASVRDKNPVIFMEPKILYRSTVEEVPLADYTLPLGKAEIVKPGETAAAPNEGLGRAVRSDTSPAPPMTPVGVHQART